MSSCWRMGVQVKNVKILWKIFQKILIPFSVLRLRSARRPQGGVWITKHFQMKKFSWIGKCFFFYPANIKKYPKRAPLFSFFEIFSHFLVTKQMFFCHHNGHKVTKLCSENFEKRKKWSPFWGIFFLFGGDKKKFPILFHKSLIEKKMIPFTHINIIIFSLILRDYLQSKRIRA